jgi:hypothetical protein
MWFVLDVLYGCAADAGIVDAGEHEHLFVLVVAHYAGSLLLLYGVVEHGYFEFELLC